MPGGIGGIGIGSNCPLLFIVIMNDLMRRIRARTELQLRTTIGYHGLLPVKIKVLLYEIEVWIMNSKVKNK